MATTKAGRPSEVIGRMGKSGGIVAQSQSHLARVTFGKAAQTETEVVSPKPPKNRGNPKD